MKRRSGLIELGGLLVVPSLLAYQMLMAGPTNAEEAAILDGMFTDPAYAPPSTRYLGLSSTTPTETGTNFTEPSSGSYARIAVAASDFDAAVGGAPSTKANAGTLTFPTATGDWSSLSPLTHFGVFDASSGGTVKNWGALTASKIVGNGDTASLGAGLLVFKLGDPADSY